MSDNATFAMVVMMIVVVTVTAMLLFGCASPPLDVRPEIARVN